MRNGFNVLYLILGIPTLILIVAVILIVNFISRVSRASLTELPFIEIDLPNSYKPTQLIESTPDTFIVYGVKALNISSSDAKLFLFSSSGKVLDELGNLKSSLYIKNIKDVGLVVSDYSSNYVDGNLNHVIEVKNGKIIKGKDLGSKFKIFESPYVQYSKSSPNFLYTNKCYISIDVENGGCNYSVETMRVEDKIIKTSRYHILDSLKVDESHTAAIVKDNSQDGLLQLLIFGSR